jgi:hypothetical protein
VDQIYIPNKRLSRQAFDANFTLSSGACLAHPHDPKLGLIFIVLNMDDPACPDRADESLQHCTTITDVSDLSVLREGHGLGIYTPDAHRQECGDTSIATTIHWAPLEPTPEKIWHICSL